MVKPVCFVPQCVAPYNRKFVNFDALFVGHNNPHIPRQGVRLFKQCAPVSRASTNRIDLNVQSVLLAVLRISLVGWQCTLSTV